jgi:hypothetical protein
LDGAHAVGRAAAACAELTVLPFEVLVSVRLARKGRILASVDGTRPPKSSYQTSLKAGDLAVAIASADCE